MTIKEMNKQDLENRAFKQLMQHITMSKDDSKCRKGHSYRKHTVDMKKQELLLKPEWICKNCGRKL